jgi:hypothetical protein
MKRLIELDVLRAAQKLLCHWLRHLEVPATSSKLGDSAAAAFANRAADAPGLLLPVLRINPAGLRHPIPKLF